MREESLLIELEKLLRLPREKATVEFKSNWELPQDIGQYISALANSAALNGHDRAWLVWGVNDTSRAVTGTVFDPFTQKVKEGANQSLIMWLQVMSEPRAEFCFHEVQYLQHRMVMLEIHPARSAPVAFQHVRYVRVDSHKVKLAGYPDKEARLWAMLGSKEDWSGALVPGATLNDLDALLLGKLPDVLNASQKANKVKNLLQGMRRLGLIHPLGARATTVWFAGAALDK